jgi:methylase of polypeptide subunit release factors
MNTAGTEQVLTALGYTESPNYCLTSNQHHPLTAHLFRAAKEAGVEGAYLFHTSPNDEILPPRPAVYIAEADTPEKAREIHHSLWNLGNVPFLVVILPEQIRVYTGFDYDSQDKRRGLVNQIDLVNRLDLGEALADYHADSIDSGWLWTSQARHLKPNNRVDTHLLRNLRALEEVLVKEDKLDLPTAHALIGKYVYLRYLWDRKILSPQWLEENGIDIASVLGRNATLGGVRKLVEALDERFNGHIFPLPLSGEKAPTDRQITRVASAFEGDDSASGQMTLFGLYDFSYIPVETLSAIYEQFLHSQGTGKKIGAVYTPEHLADYLLAELNYVKPLKKGMKVLDPCCGSGVFLVLAYRKLIETELSKRSDQKLRPTELREILTESIFGVERSADACYVAELSLILTMLHYITPPELHRNKQFQFPVLHNKQIFEADFFDDSSEFWQKDEHFDWVIGNPPWIEPDKNDEDERTVLSWISTRENQQKRPVAGNRVAEAFSWRVTDLLNGNGCIGLVLNASSLFNHESKRYRQEFFKQHEVLKVTNFTNLRYVMFSSREGAGEASKAPKAPAATIIYRKMVTGRQKASIIHYGPFAINQVFSKAWEQARRKEAWILTINENEISTIPPEEAEIGEVLTWKLVLWGTYRDKKALQRLQRLFPTTVESFRKAKGWYFHEGVALREHQISSEDSKYPIKPMPELRGRKFFDAATMTRSGYRFFIPKEAFKIIPESRCFVTKQGGQRSLKEVGSAHILFNFSYFVFSDKDFILQSPDKRLSAPAKDADELRALSVFFSSSLVQYFLFFHSPAWGVDRNRLYTKDIKRIPIPNLTVEQITELATLQKELAAKEANSTLGASDLQEILDEKMGRVFGIPKNLSLLARDFVRMKLPLVHGRITDIATHPPQMSDLLAYGILLRDELDQFTKGRVRHQVSFTCSPGREMVICQVAVKNASQPFDVSVNSGNEHLNTALSNLNRKLKQQFSQWVYVRRGLRIFEGPNVYICKTPRLIDWTKTQALNDADDLIAEVLSRSNGDLEVAANGAG